MLQKKYYTMSFMTALLLFLSIGCKKYLGKVPDMRTDLNSVENIKSLLVTAYPAANYMGFTEAASDNSGDKGPLASGVTKSEINRGPYMFEDITGENGNDSPNYYWYHCWEAVSAANHALEAISKVTEDKDKEEYLPYKGEALLCRAYAHFMLVSLFAHIYEPKTADQYPGIPYVTKSGTVVQETYDRHTVAYDYDKIEQDLLEGLPLIDNSVYDVPKFHFNKQAAEAFATRFYLFKKDYKEVIKHANKVFPGGDFSSALRPWISIYNNWETSEMRVNYAKAEQTSNLLLASMHSKWARYYYRYRFGYTAYMLSTRFDSPNVTGKPWGQRTSSYSSGTNKRMNKFEYYFYYTTAHTGQTISQIPLFSAEEVLFNRAEAYTYLGEYSKALDDLNLYASKRINGYDPTTDKVTFKKIQNFYGISGKEKGLIKTILDFKRDEYAQEGLRWFDILRHKITVKHEVLDAQGNASKTIVLKPDDPRRIFQIPPESKLAGLEPNPR